MIISSLIIIYYYFIEDDPYNHPVHILYILLPKKPWTDPDLLAFLKLHRFFIFHSILLLPLKLLLLFHFVLKPVTKFCI